MAGLLRKDFFLIKLPDFETYQPIHLHPFAASCNFRKQLHQRLLPSTQLHCNHLTTSTQTNHTILSLPLNCIVNVFYKALSAFLRSLSRLFIIFDRLLSSFHHPSIVFHLLSIIFDASFVQTTQHSIPSIKAVSGHRSRKPTAVFAHHNRASRSLSKTFNRQTQQCVNTSTSSTVSASTQSLSAASSAVWLSGELERPESSSSACPALPADPCRSLDQSITTLFSTQSFLASLEAATLASRSFR